jgi:[ribosomal protein S18]-alanine N-acetyltransferase
MHALDARCFAPPIAYSRAELHYFLHHPRSTSYVAEEAGSLAGFCIVDWKLEAGQRVGHFITIDVAPERRRSGLGRRLMLAAEQHLAALGCKSVMLEVGTANQAALAFYARQGYSESGRIPGYYQDGSDALVLRKPIAPAVPASPE